MASKLKVVHVSSEIEPFSKTGGLASVVGSLPQAQKDLGANVICITPYYENITTAENGFEVVAQEIPIQIDGVIYPADFLKTKTANGLEVYFIAQKFFFGKRDKLYGAENDNSRFFFFDVATIELLKKIDWKPDIIHCHDWHSGLIPYFLKGRLKDDPFFINTKTIYTIHNLAYQFGHDWFNIPQEKRDDGRRQLGPIENTEEIEYINFAKRAIMNADAINTVSETYREEILTKDFGEELHRILKNREEKFFGIVNGIDYNEYNPKKDPGLKLQYDEKSIEHKTVNKEWLQKKFGLTVDSDIPLLCMTSRIVEQKGFELFAKIIDILMTMKIQIIVMGDGDPKIVSSLHKTQKRLPKKFVIIPFDSNIETSIYAGADIFMLPSRFEPCGINQMIAMRYGCIPIVHQIGGLADTVSNFDPISNKKGNGFSFKRYSSRLFLVAIVRALETYKHGNVWKKIVMSSMTQANSWVIPAKKYIKLYKDTLKAKQKHD